MPDFDLNRFRREPVLGILRHLPESSLDGVMQSALAVGLAHVEITLNTPGALKLIEQAADRFGERLCIGAGTVLRREEAESAVSAGARFLVAPSLNEWVADYCVKKKIPYFPGALTPTEIERAWNCGAAMIKVFPASLAGAKYFREVKGPFPEIPLMAVGGVGPANVGEYLGSGADAVAFGGSIFSPERLLRGDYSAMRKDMEDFLLAVRAFYSKM